VDSVQWTGSTLPAPEPPTNAWHRLTYTYDASGRRIEKKYDGELITKYVYDGDNCIAEYDINSNLKRKYIYGPGVDQPICMIEATVSPAATYYYHFDALGSVVALTNSSGNTVEVYEYSIFGQVGASDPNHPNRFLFTGREFDKETGLYYYRARYYKPEIGRFLQADSVGYGAGMNLYRYCSNNPWNMGDPYGNDACEPNYLGDFNSLTDPNWIKPFLQMWLDGATPSSNCICTDCNNLGSALAQIVDSLPADESGIIGYASQHGTNNKRFTEFEGVDDDTLEQMKQDATKAGDRQKVNKINTEQKARRTRPSRQTKNNLSNLLRDMAVGLCNSVASALPSAEAAKKAQKVCFCVSVGAAEAAITIGTFGLAGGAVTTATTVGF
jgi:RHS repeat-associated protein